MNIRTLGLQKAGHFFVFRYAVGLEDQVVEQLMRLADDRESYFDWTDAATVSLQVTRQAAEDCLGDIARDPLTAD